jgi:predicted amidohydrolase
MNDTTYRIALANLRPAASPDESLARTLGAIDEASRAGARLVAFPECYVPGYRALDPRVPPPDPAFLERAHARIAAECGRASVVAAVGTERLVAGAWRITVLVAGPRGDVLGFHDKVQLDPSEDGLYARGVGRQVFRDGPLTFGIAICHEGWRYPETVRWAARHGAQLVLHPHFHPAEPGAYAPTTFGDPANTFHEKAMLCRAAENTCWFASVNVASPGSPTTSAIARPDGTLLAWQPYGVDGLLVADLDLALATRLLASRCRSDEYDATP